MNETSYLENKLDALGNIITKYKKVCVAYSGGVDSSLLVYICSKLVPTISVTAFGPMFPRRELHEAMDFVTSLGNVDFLFTPVDPLSLDDFRNNTPQRCYACKLEIFKAIKVIADEEDCDVIFDGTNASDLDDYRPGLKALKELGIVSPFVEADITKADIYDLSKMLGLPTQNKPASACLASRIPTGEPIDEGKLSKVEQGEEILRDYGFSQYRLRLTGGVDGVLECPEKEFVIFERNKDDIAKKLKDIGVKISDKPRAYKRGSMNQTG